MADPDDLGEGEYPSIVEGVKNWFIQSISGMGISLTVPKGHQLPIIA